MSGLLGRLRYFVADAVDEWRHSPGVNLVAWMTLTSVLFVAGLVLLVLANLETHLRSWERDARVEVYLKDDAPEEAVQAVREALEAAAGVLSVEYIGKEEALRRFEAVFGPALARAADELETNPLPASFEVLLDSSLDPVVAAAGVADRVGGLAGVEEVRFDREWLGRLKASLDLVRLGGGALAAVVLVAVVLVMASVLRLAVYARRDEVSIMLLVGATPAFVRGPFLVAGLFHGLAGSAAALLLVEAARRAALVYAGAGNFALAQLVLGRPLPWGYALMLLGLGVGVGVVGSYLAVRKVAT